MCNVPFTGVDNLRRETMTSVNSRFVVMTGNLASVHFLKCLVSSPSCLFNLGEEWPLNIQLDFFYIFSATEEDMGDKFVN